MTSEDIKHQLIVIIGCIVVVGSQRLVEARANLKCCTVLADGVVSVSYSCFTFKGSSGGLHRLIPGSLPTEFMPCNFMESPEPEVRDKIRSVSVSKWQKCK